MLENGPALEVDSGNGSQGISCKSRSLDFKEPSDNADEVLEASSNAQDERNEYFSSVNLEETRAEYFSDSGSDWNDTGSAKNSTPVISREKAVLRYASYMERHVGTQTDFSLAVADVPMEIEEALKEFRLEDTTDTKPKFCGTPIQAWIKKGFVVRSSSPKSFEKRRCYNSHSSSEVRHQLKEPCAWRSQPSVLSDDASFVEPNSGGSSIGRISNASSIADVSRVEDVSLHLNISGMMR
ncbi:unnamed protein product [Notodromas monacha]|uniref:Uncharacterized protein n=1 Tax=Notodromas monacha TaxID=399045 RepID=A0A7R9GKU3_9CRUS|nr:unnamed protein product [Notodromas monacha]CAG0925002.1 unnamed protein product [Notodromas monacha]